MRCCQILHAPSVSSTIWPGNFLEVDVPNTFPSEAQLAIETPLVAVPPKHPMPGSSPLLSTLSVGSLDLSIPLLSQSLLKRTIISARLALSLTPSLPHPYHLMCPPLQPNTHSLRQACSTLIRFPLTLMVYSLPMRKLVSLIC